MHNSPINDSLLPHLLDIASNPAAQGLILAGGFGLQLKRQHILATQARTYIDFEELPEVRPTQDMDFFLLIELFTKQEQGAATREALNALSYEVYTPKRQFGQPLGPQFAVESRVKVDLLARSPGKEENVKVHGGRVGYDSGTGLHGRETPEAFAVEDMPVEIAIGGAKTDGALVQTRILVPHPYAWLNMKLKAAHDWREGQNTPAKAKIGSEKHAFDVYILVAMLSPTEIETAEVLAQKYAQHPLADEIKNSARVLYGTPDAPGFREAQRQAGRPIEQVVFWQGLCAALGIAP